MHAWTNYIDYSLKTIGSLVYKVLNVKQDIIEICYKVMQEIAF